MHRRRGACCRSRRDARERGARASYRGKRDTMTFRSQPFVNRNPAIVAAGEGISHPSRPLICSRVLYALIPFPCPPIFLHSLLSLSSLSRPLHNADLNKLWIWTRRDDKSQRPSSFVGSLEKSESIFPSKVRSDDDIFYSLISNFELIQLTLCRGNICHACITESDFQFLILKMILKLASVNLPTKIHRVKGSPDHMETKFCRVPWMGSVLSQSDIMSAARLRRIISHDHPLRWANAGGRKIRMFRKRKRIFNFAPELMNSKLLEEHIMV